MPSIHTRSSNRNWKYLVAITRPALAAAPRDYLDSIRVNLERDGVTDAVARHDSAALFEHLVWVSQYQGISDANAAAFTAKNGLVGWEDIDVALENDPTCPRLRSYWSFSGCGYRKAAGVCGEPRHIGRCPVPTHPTRKGALIIAAYSLALFVRDVCNDDLIAWIDRRLAAADPGRDAPDRAVRMGAALIQPLTNIYGIGAKVWSLALADLLLGGDPARERWVTTGASLVVIDTLLHNFLHRTGTLACCRSCGHHPKLARPAFRTQWG